MLLPRMNVPVVPPCGLWQPRHLPSASGLCTTGSLWVSILWQKVQVSVLSLASLNVWLCASVKVWHASQAFTFTGPCNTLYFFTFAWHSLVVHVSGPAIAVGFCLTADCACDQVERLNKQIVQINRYLM